MSETWRHRRLPEIVTNLARRPQHEAVRTLLTALLTEGFGVSYATLDHEVRMPEIRGRADTLFATTVFEFKSDLRREQDDITEIELLAVAGAAYPALTGDTSFSFNGKLIPVLNDGIDKNDLPFQRTRRSSPRIRNLWPCLSHWR